MNIDLFRQQQFDVQLTEEIICSTNLIQAIESNSLLLYEYGSFSFNTISEEWKILVANPCQSFDP